MTHTNARIRLSGDHTGTPYIDPLESTSLRNSLRSTLIVQISRRGYSPRKNATFFPSGDTRACSPSSANFCGAPPNSEIFQSPERSFAPGTADARMWL